MKKNYYSKTPILGQTLKKSNKNVFLFFFMLVLGLTYTHAQVSIPDSAFEQQLINHGLDNDGNGVPNGQLSATDAANAANYTGSLEMHQKGITDLSGIELFVKVTSIQIGNNEDLGDAEVKRVTDNLVNLTSLKLTNTGITELNVANLTNLTILEANLTTNNLELNLQANQTYYWQVHVSDGTAKSIGAIWTFMTN